MNPFAKIYTLFLLAIAVWLATQFMQHTPIQTQLTALLPQSEQSPTIQAAEHFQETQLNQQVMIFIGANDHEQAFQAAQTRLNAWQNMPLFAQIDGKIEPNLDAFRASLHTLGAATLPETQIRQLHENPEQYFTERAEAAANPFSGSLLTLEDDWLGFSRFVFEKQNSVLNWHNEYAMLYTEFNGKTWVGLRAKLTQHGTHGALLNWWQNEKNIAQTENHAFIASSGALFAANAKQSAERESSLMSVIGLTLTFTLLLVVFRTWRIFALLLPLGVGILVGLVATVAVFGEVHALTLVVGTSLVGVLVDFPLHWLAPALFRQPEHAWHAQQSMYRVLPSFCISLSITVAGYILLYFTPLPVLQQTAVFSAAALLGALGATVCFLPPLMAHHTPRKIQMVHQPMSPKFRFLFVILAIFLCTGITQTHWQDDMRQWANLRADLLADTQKIAQISQMDNTQTIVLTAHSTDDLLQKSRELAHNLRDITPVQSLHQWILPIHEQIALKKQFAHLSTQTQSFEPLLALGIPSETIQAALKTAAHAPNITLADSLKAPHAEAFRDLYLGEINGKFVGLVRTGSLKPHINIAPYLPENATLLNKRTQLNQQFNQTRNLAAWLKMISLILAWCVLVWAFSWRRGSAIMGVPLLALAVTLGALGWLNITIGLFVMFGLLLTLAIGVDYAVYAFTAPETPTAKLAGISLAAITTGISFGLLAFSGTPAVAAFGVSVSLGVLINGLAIWLLFSFRLPESFFINNTRQ